MTAAVLALLALQEPLVVEHFAQRGGFNEAIALPPRKDAARVLVGGAVGSPPDLLAGLDAVVPADDELEALAGPLPAPFVCANVLDEAGRPVAAPFRIRDRVAYVGVVKPLKLPKGWTAKDPEEAVKGLKIEADRVVLLAAMDRIEAAALLRKLDGVHAALVPALGTRDPAPLAIGSKWLVMTPAGTATLGTLTLRGAAAEGRWEAVTLGDADLRRAREALAAGASAPKPLTKKLAGPVQPPAEKLEAGRRIGVGTRAANRALECEVRSVLLTPEHGGVKAPEGRAWLVVETEWTNVLPMKFLFERELPVAFEVQDFREILFVVGDGARLARVHEERSAAPGGLLAGPFSLPANGSVRSGNAVFEVPEKGWERLELRFHDFAHGHLAVPVLGKPAAAPAGSAKRNDAVELRVAGFREAAEWNGRAAPEGFSFAVVDLLSASVLPHEVDASAFDPKAPKGARAKVSSMGRWQDLDRHLQVVADGEFAYAPVDAVERYLLPDLATGREEAFLVAKGWISLELRADFPRIGGPSLPEPIVPAPLAIPLKGQPPAPKERSAVSSADDEGLVLSVLGKRVEGPLFVVELRLKNGRKEGADVDAGGFAALNEAGERIETHDATRSGRRPAPLRVPAGESRSFEAVFETATAPRRLAWGEKTLRLGE